MANNRVVYGNTVVMDITDTTATASDVASGKAFYDKSGRKKIGFGSSKPELLDSTTVTANTSSTSATTLTTLSLGANAWTSERILYVKVRDTAGARNGYFYGADIFYFNYQATEGATASSTGYALRNIYSKNTNGTWYQYNPSTSTGYGVYSAGITKAGALTIAARYNATYSKTINGTYRVDVYLIDYPVGNIFDTSIAYAVLDSEGALTFFRSDNTYTSGTGQTVTDIDGNTYTGEVFTGIEKVTGSSASIPWDARRSDITKVVTVSGQTIRPISLVYWFYNCSNVTEIDLSSFDTSIVTSASRMCPYCSKLESIDVSSFDTGNMTNMFAMFAACSSLENLDITNFDTSKVTNFGYMFSQSSSLKNLDLRNFNTESATNMAYMFKGCSDLEHIYANDWYDSSRTVTSTSMFENCTSLPGFSSSQVTWTKARIKPNGYFTAK